MHACVKQRTGKISFLFMILILFTSKSIVFAILRKVIYHALEPSGMVIESY